MLKLGLQNPCLDCIQSAVISFYFVAILLQLAMVAQHANLSRDHWVVCRNRSRLPASAQVLSRIEAESTRHTHRPRLPPAILSSRKVGRPVSLTSVFDHKQLVSLRELQDGIHVRHLAVQVYGDNPCDRTSRLLVQ